METTEQPTDTVLQRRHDVELVLSIIGVHLRFNPWDDHWREPTRRAAESIVDKLTNA